MKKIWQLVMIIAALSIASGNVSGAFARDITVAATDGGTSRADSQANHAGSSNGVVSPSSSIEQLVKSLADAFTAKTLGSLDAERPFPGKVRIVIEHSLAEDNAKDRFEVKNFKTLEEAEHWLKSRERDDGTPARITKPLVRCRKGVCTYNFEGGILHNQLYLKRISYGLRNGRPYIKTIYLLDGD